MIFYYRLISCNRYGCHEYLIYRNLVNHYMTKTEFSKYVNALIGEVAAKDGFRCAMFVANTDVEIAPDGTDFSYCLPLGTVLGAIKGIHL